VNELEQLMAMNLIPANIVTTTKSKAQSKLTWQPNVATSYTAAVLDQHPNSLEPFEDTHLSNAVHYNDYLKKFKLQMRAEPSALVIQRWWRTQGLRRRFLHWRKMYHQSKVKILGPYFTSWNHYVIAIKHHQKKLVKYTFHMWKVRNKL
jgi:hypothetical protein